MPLVESVRAKINQHHVLAVVALLAIIVVALIVARGSFGRAKPLPPQPTEEAFYNESSATIEMLPLGQVPPIPKEGGGFLVKAYLVPGTTEILYLEKYSDEAKPVVEALWPSDAPPRARADILKTKHPGCLVRSPVPGSPWVAADSDEGRTLINK